MKKFTKAKKALIPLLVFSFLTFIAAAVLYVIAFNVITPEGLEVFVAQLQLAGVAFVDFAGIAEHLILSLILYIPTVLFVVFLIVGIVSMIVKGRGVMVAPIISLLLSTVLGMYLGFYYEVYIVAITGLLELGDQPSIIGAILLIAMLALAAISLILSYVAYFVSLHETIKNSADHERVVIDEEQEEVVETVTTTITEARIEEPAPVAAVVPEPVIVEEPIKEVEIQPEPMPAFMPEPEPVEEEPYIEPVKEEKVEEVKPEPQPATSKDELASMLKEIVRDIVRDEISRSTANNNVNNQPKQESVPTNQQLTGATFGGPLVVQYFNGGINGVEPAKQGQPAVAPAPAAVAPAPAPVEAKPLKEEVAPVQEEKVTPTPVVAPAPAPTPVVAVPALPEKEKKQIVRISFDERLFASDKELQNNYNEIKNEILSYGVKSRVSNSGDTFRLHRKTYIKLTIAGKSLKLYFALDPKDYAETKIPVQDASNKAIYEEIPLIFKVKSPLSMKRCKQLIQDVMEEDNLEQGEIKKVNWVKELKLHGISKSSKDDD